MTVSELKGYLRFGRYNILGRDSGLGVSDKRHSVVSLGVSHALRLHDHANTLNNISTSDCRESSQKAKDAFRTYSEAARFREHGVMIVE